MIRAVRSTGLKIVATVCDQGPTNRSAINALLKATQEEFVSLGEENRCHGFLIDGEEVNHFYDPPHLLKGIRNNLMTKDLHFTQDGVKKIAKWQDVVDFYMLDEGDDDVRMCPKLTDAHVLADKVKKMKVSYCAQVFNQ